MATIPDVYMPNPSNTPRRRIDPASAYTVNEPGNGQPSRTGNTPADRAASLQSIIGWLSPETPAHKRYQPTASATFCNIYAHDYCKLAGVYLPRVWWNAAAIANWKAGQSVSPQYGVTIVEVTANALVGWFKDYGSMFGWRSSTSLTELQDEANKGSVVVMVGRAPNHGHIVAVAPESAQHQARRDPAGAITTPLQSQAGSTNFNYGATSTWWKTHTDPGFWIHD
jgi:hypothetical protein